MASHGPIPTERAYLAGYLDGEGCLSFNQSCPRVAVTTTFPQVLHRLAEAFGGNVRPRKTLPNQRSLFEWAVSGEKAVSLCYRLESYFHEKADQAACIIEADRVEPSKRGPFIKRCRELKRIDHGDL